VEFYFEDAYYVESHFSELNLSMASLLQRMKKNVSGLYKDPYK
jgi:hypothetical protein